MTTDTTIAPAAHAFDTRLQAYKLAKARLDLHCAQYSADDYDDAVQAELDALSDDHTNAMLELLMAPAQNQRDLWYKIDIIVSEEVNENWRHGAECLALLRCDASRVLDFRLVPGKA